MNGPDGLFCYGYNAHEVGLDVVPPKVDVKIVVRQPDSNERRPVRASLGCHVLGFAPPTANPSSQKTMISGVFKRFARETPMPDPTFLAGLRDFTKRFCEERFTPLSAEQPLDLEWWLSMTNYPEWRKNQLRQAWEDCRGVLTKQHFVCKSFMKDESYPEFKHARGINSRTDAVKCYCGPLFKAIEQQVYDTERMPEFIKHVPVPERPDYIMNMLYVEAGQYVATDYTAFESHFVKMIMENCEFVLYEYMTSSLPGHEQFMSLSLIHI